MATIDVGKKYTADEYLKLEEASPIRHEFYHGNVYEMEATILIHN